MILLLVIGEKSAYKKESRERVRKREAQRKATQSLLFSKAFEKNFTSFPAKTSCAAWRGTHTHGE